MEVIVELFASAVVETVKVVLEVTVAAFAAVVVAPSSLPGMAVPTPLLVHGVGIGSWEVSGLSAGSSS